MIPGSAPDKAACTQRQHPNASDKPEAVMMVIFSSYGSNDDAANS
jgi:hypothetical protein